MKMAAFSRTLLGAPGWVGGWAGLALAVPAVFRMDNIIKTFKFLGKDPSFDGFHFEIHSDFQP